MKANKICDRDQMLGTSYNYEIIFNQTLYFLFRYEIITRREGDIAECYADATLAQRELNWTAKRDIKAMCKDTWNWQKKNPKGYQTS